MRILQQFVILFQLLSSSVSQAKLGCVLKNIPKYGDCEANLECTAYIDDLDIVIKKWDCIQIKNKPVNFDYYYNGLDYPEITYQSNYNLYVNGMDIYGEGGVNRLTEVKNHIKSVTLNNGNQVLIPNFFYSLPYVTEINVNYNILEMLSINKFYRNQNLQKINVSHNLITELETSSENTYLGNKDLTSLTSLDLSYNLIEELHNNTFLHVSKLQNVHLSHNKIKSFDVLTFEGLTKVWFLDLSHNRIREIGQAFARLANLITLCLNNNLITSITKANFDSMFKLESLILTHNFIANIEDRTFQSLTSLKNIDISYNRIKIITTNLFRNNYKINSLFLSNNNIQIIEIGSFEGKNITDFHINSNYVSGSIEQSTFSGINIEVLDLSYSKIESLGDKAFYAMNTKLMSLNLTSNKINNISISAFKSLKMLKYLDISNNCLTLLNFETKDLYNLTALYVYNNSIQKIQKSFFKYLVRVKVLDLSHNLIDAVEANSFSELSHLKKLILKNNILTNQLDANIFKGLISLSEIELMNSRVQSYNNYSFSSMTYLVSVNSSNGQLSNIQYNTFVNTSALEILDLSYNLLENFAVNVNNMTRLKHLFLNNNKIRKITNDTFLGLTFLLKLDISHNNLLAIESNAFKSLKNVLYLQLFSNPEMEIYSTLFDDLPILTKVSLENIERPFSFKNAINSSIINLQLSNCSIAEVNKVYVYKIKNVVTLNLSNNKIGFIDKLSFLNMSSLVTLDMSFNLIKDLLPGSFLGTSMINTINLHSNYIESIQFGVLDGLDHLNLLNLSSNLLHNFELKLLHTTPRLAILVLDDNLITNIRFYTLNKTNIKVISIGGNQISCHDILDTSNTLEVNITITAQKLNYHTENVNGITCKTGVKNVAQDSVNNNNFTESIINFTHVIKKIQESIEGFTNTSTARENIIKNNFVNVAESVDRLASHSNKTQLDFVHYLKILSDINNETQFHLQHIADVLELKNLTLSKLKKADENSREEFSNVMQKWQDSLNKTPGKDRSVEDIKVLLYFISVCIALLLVILMCSYFYMLLKKHSIFRSNVNYISSHPSTTVMEME